MKIQLLALMTGAALLAGCDQGADRGGVGEDVDIQYDTDRFDSTTNAITNGAGGAFDQDQGMQQGQGASPTTGETDMQTTPGAGATTPGQGQGGSPTTGAGSQTPGSGGASPTTGGGAAGQTNQGTQQ